jgi:hypothetical protein
MKVGFYSIDVFAPFPSSHIARLFWLFFSCMWQQRTFWYAASMLRNSFYLLISTVNFRSNNHYYFDDVD